MALKIALAAKNPFALERAKNELVAAHEGECLVYGFRNLCEVYMAPDTVVKLISETDWRRGAYCREQFDQIFRVGPEPLGIDFMLELQECLKGSCVPERSSRMADWICETCVHYPPSSFDGKPCCMCNPDDPMLNCYQQKENENED